MICSVVRSYSKKRESNAAAEKNRRQPGLIAVRALPGTGTTGILKAGNVSMRCALGRTGITAKKREGDGATPLASMAVCGGYIRRRSTFAARSALDLAPIGRRDGWCDAPADRNYNRPVRLPYAASHEEMWREDGLYDICLVLDWNVTERRRGRGSAIFLHVAQAGYPPTEGCVAVSARDMARLLPLLRRGTQIVVRR